ncbi:MAG: hypothetical protein AAGD14_09145 [Planctomycetota bacterium]
MKQGEKRVLRGNRAWKYGASGERGRDELAFAEGAGNYVLYLLAFLAAEMWRAESGMVAVSDLLWLPVCALVCWWVERCRIRWIVRRRHTVALERAATCPSASR